MADVDVASVWANYNGKNPDWAAAAEVRQSTEAINAAMRAKVQHVVYSTLESYLPRQPLPHFDAKAKGECGNRSMEVSIWTWGEPRSTLLLPRPRVTSADPTERDALHCAGRCADAPTHSMSKAALHAPTLLGRW